MNKQESIKAIIVDDEEDSRIVLNNLIRDYCEGVEVLALASALPEAVIAINKHQPDVVFLDIEMPVQNGFQLFDYFETPQFETIFSTAYDQYALKALRLSALDYLLKPIDIEDLRIALKKLRKKKNLAQQYQKISALKANLNHQLKKLTIPTNDGMLFLDFKDILYCEANGNYTYFYLTNGKKVLVSKTIKLFETILEEFQFFRANRSILINLKYVDKLIRQKPAVIFLTNGKKVSLSESRKKVFIALMDII